MGLVASEIGIVTIVLLMAIFVASAGRFALGAMCLPSMMALTAITYFFVMPAISLSGNNESHFGMTLTTLEWPHFAVLLYALGAYAACVAGRGDLAVDPAQLRLVERRSSDAAFWLLAASAAAGIAVTVALGRLNLMADENYSASIAAEVSDFSFLNMSFTMLLPLTLVVLIRENFNARSLVVLVVVCLILLTTGFRTRLILLGYTVAASFLLMRRIKIRVSYIVVGTIVGILGGNAMGQARTYGQGVDLAKLDGMSWTDILFSFGGEVGALYAFSFTASNPLPELVLGKPWIVGLARLIPSFIWKDKPGPDYLAHYLGGFSTEGVEQAGVAAPQHVEMLLQFGWVGLPILAFLYFCLAIHLVRRLNRLGREARIAGCALVPVFFGFYMQTRGYFFQILADGLFTFGPLFLMHLGDKRPLDRQIAPASRTSRSSSASERCRS
ncbi:hypothetical protein IY145_24530 [Methylosinus sp. H3A]|uniref:hypothetical protein n=1 Tax=Methylosinus sp. H3A TaxID=2785786 RepID=UPI0018C216DF|nr:hypothetical protein [Methylosinus sp. H3A]MBG0812500.1 hypothetical protein [Methylosinus sp. H3A]